MELQHVTPDWRSGKRPSQETGETTVKYGVGYALLEVSVSIFSQFDHACLEDSQHHRPITSRWNDIRHRPLEVHISPRKQAQSSILQVLGVVCDRSAICGCCGDGLIVVVDYYEDGSEDCGRDGLGPVPGCSLRCGLQVGLCVGVVSVCCGNVSRTRTF